MDFERYPSDNGVMIQIRAKKVALALVRGVSLKGRVVWASSKIGTPDRCLPCSALSVITKSGGYSELSTQKVDDLLGKLEWAYQSRVPDGDYYFNKEALRQLGRWEIWLLSAPLKQNQAPLDSIFKWIKTRGTSHHWGAPKFKNESFILFLKRPNEEAQHAISIHCNGLWSKTGGFGFEDTEYINQRPVRRAIMVETLAQFYKKFAEYIAEWNYQGAMIQPMLLEPLSTDVKSVPIASAWQKLKSVAEAFLHGSEKEKGATFQ